MRAAGRASRRVDLSSLRTRHHRRLDVVVYAENVLSFNFAGSALEMMVSVEMSAFWGHDFLALMGFSASAATRQLARARPLIPQRVLFFLPCSSAAAAAQMSVSVKYFLNQ